MDISTDFASLVRSLRDHFGLTQEQFASKLGVSFSTVNGWENKKRDPLPFLRRRLLAMAKQAGLGDGSGDIRQRRKGTR